MSTIEIAEPLQRRFQELRHDWISKTRHLSNTAQIAMVFSYQKIIGLGPQVVPLILLELQKKKRITGSGHWKRSPERILLKNAPQGTWKLPPRRGFTGENKTDI